MTMIYLVNQIDAGHLAKVKEEMMRRGTPTIRAIDGGDHLIAVEGSHRLQAAADLGMAVNIEMIDEHALVDLDTLDWDDNNWFDERVVSGAEFIAGFTRGGFPSDQPIAEIEVA